MLDHSLSRKIEGGQSVVVLGGGAALQVFGRPSSIRLGCHGLVAVRDRFYGHGDFVCMIKQFGLCLT